MVLIYSGEIPGYSSYDSEEAMVSTTVMPSMPADKILADTLWPDLLK
jgi:hypothetical protein